MPKTALLIIDLQNDYFQGGKCPLIEAKAAAQQASVLLKKFRAAGFPVVHVQHEMAFPNAPYFIPNTEGVKIHPLVASVEGEAVVTKNYPNAFRETNLKAILEELAVKNLVVCGAMSHMCVDSAVRAAADFGYSCTVAEDACATLDLAFNEVTHTAAQVHGAFMAALGQAFARVTTTDAIVALLFPA